MEDDLCQFSLKLREAGSGQQKVTQHRKVNKGVQTELNVLSFPVFMIIIMQMKLIVLFWHEQGERNKTKRTASHLNILL